MSSAAHVVTEHVDEYKERSVPYRQITPTRHGTRHGRNDASRTCCRCCRPTVPLLRPAGKHTGGRGKHTGGRGSSSASGSSHRTLAAACPVLFHICIGAAEIRSSPQPCARPCDTAGLAAAGALGGDALGHPKSILNTASQADNLRP